MKKLLIIPLSLIISSLIILWLIINPLRHELPLLRQTININRGQMEAYLQTLNQKKQISGIDEKNQNNWTTVKQTALPRGQELDLITMLENLAEKQGWGDFDTVSFALSFVQSLPYTSDVVTTSYDEYPRYPVETIVDGGGDCEDTSVLFSSIVRGMGYGTVLLKLEEDKHMAVGVLISQNIVNNWNQNYSLTYYTSNGKIYAYCETTGEGWELGHKPEDLKSTTATIISV